MSRWRSAWIRPNTSGRRRAPPSRARPRRPPARIAPAARRARGPSSPAALTPPYSSVSPKNASPVPADPDEVLGRAPAVGMVVQPRHGAAEPVQVHGARRPVWILPSIQREHEQVRGPVTPADETVAVSSPSRVGTGSGTSRSVSARRAASQRSSDRTAATGSTSRPCRAGRCTRSRNRSRRPAIDGVDPEGGVLPVGDEPQPRIDQRDTRRPPRRPAVAVRATC